jgi:hypothetical protein
VFSQDDGYEIGILECGETGRKAIENYQVSPKYEVFEWKFTETEVWIEVQDHQVAALASIGCQTHQIDCETSSAFHEADHVLKEPVASAGR